MVGKIRSRKADQAAKPGIATVHGQCMSVAISWAQKAQLAKCDILVGFPKSSHILRIIGYKFGKNNAGIIGCLQAF